MHKSKNVSPKVVNLKKKWSTWVDHFAARLTTFSRYFMRGMLPAAELSLVYCKSYVFEAAGGKLIAITLHATTLFMTSEINAFKPFFQTRDF